MEPERNYAQLLKRLGRNIKHFREALNWTQEETAEKGDFNYRYYQKLESGSYSPNLRTLYNLARVFKVKVTELLG